TFEHAAGPTRVVVGVVRDRDTGKPIPGASVHSIKLAGDDLHGRTFIRTTTDREGRFRLVGLPKGADNRIQAEAPEGLPYPVLEKGVPDPAGLVPVTVDFEMKSGVWIKGRVIDKVSRKPV